MNSDEIWLPVCGREGDYEVSNHGSVRGLPGGHGRGAKGQILKAGKNSAGYPGVVLARCKKKEWRSTHRLVAMAFIPNPNGYPFVNHKDSDRMNSHVSNLEWCTAKANSIHAARDRRMSGPNNAKAVPVEVLLEGRSLGTFDSILQASKALGLPYPSLVYGRHKGHVVRRLI